LGVGAVGGEGAFGDVGLDAALDGVPGDVVGAVEVAAGDVEVLWLGELADGGVGVGGYFPAAELEGGGVAGDGLGGRRQVAALNATATSSPPTSSSLRTGRSRSATLACPPLPRWLGGERVTGMVH
jgi:hypothetical protein